MDTDFYTSPEWRALRERVLARDANRCTVSRLLGGECGATLHVHHIVPVFADESLALDEDNCGSACNVHHPVWEALARALRRRGKPPPCRHNHRYAYAREECARQRGYLVV